jgi:hypothetical protein
LLSHQVDIHTLSPNFQEDMQFPKVIIVKPDSAKFASLETDPRSSVCILETITSRAPEFLKICILEDHLIENIFSFGSVT